jgi:type IX secretion system substrate protein
MKKGKPVIFLFCLLLMSCIAAHAQPIDWDSVRAAYVVKYQPQQMPAWLFPIVFEEGSGQRDTVFLGYDEDAQDQGWPPKDTVFGERFLPIDTSSFNAHWSSIVNDSAFKSIIRLTFLGSSFSISFFKGIHPLKMYWDRGAFYSDSLPFADKDPAPRVQGEIGGTDMYSYNPDSSICVSISLTLMTDTGTGTTGDNYCRRSDSIVFYNNSSNLLSGIGYFRITYWNGYILGIKKNNQPDKISFYPNPANKQFTLKFAQPTTAQVIIYNITGQIVMTFQINNRQEYQKDISSLSPGLFIVQVKTKYGLFNGKLMVE